MSVFHAAVLGAVQGLTEFIPISSSGHLVLVPEALGWDQPGLGFDVLLHVASLAALIGYFRKDLIGLVRGVFSGDRSSRRLLLLLVIGTVPAAIAGLVLNDYFEKAFDDAKSSAIQLLFTAAILVGAELVYRHHRARQDRLRSIDDLNATDATVIGVAQAIAILPGISRSGSTIAAGLGLKMERDDAARFAFLLAIPALFGAALVKVPDLGGAELTGGPAIAGFIVSLVTSYIAIAGLIRYLRNRTLYPFAIYCVIAGVFFYLVV
ncbi:MAG: undecaprenyl-diphosphatase [Actinomycetota bacterium]|jgi:undecaprenyl-diphosphatase|nr:undecaprenyl-diphosphatase [Actinomycetota bacterium]